MRGRDYAELVAFMMVADERSFRAAALRLEISPSVLSRTIRGLEARIGNRLLDRTTRSVSLTQAGRSLLDQIRPAFANVDSAVASASDFGGRPAGRLRLNLPRLAFQMALAPKLATFAEACPEVQLDLVIDDGLHDIVDGGFDAGIRMGGKVAKDMIAVRLTPDIQPTIAASPAYLARRSVPEAPHDLLDHACLNYRWSETGATFPWRFIDGERVTELSVSGPLLANDSDALIEAALAGLGFLYLPSKRLHDHLSSGRLVEVLPGTCAVTPGFFLYFPDRRHERVALRRLIEVLRS